MSRRLTVLGTASQAPTPDRLQGGYLLEWDREKVLFDPGEGSQIQLLRAGCSPSRITRVCITHFHGDHCLGLPGVVMSHALAPDRSPVQLHYEPDSRHHIERLLSATALDCEIPVVHDPIADGDVIVGSEFSLSARRLDHPTPTIGFRLEAPARWHLLPERLEELGIHGSDRRRVLGDGAVTVDHRTITLEMVGEWRRGLTVAFVMDTRPCDSALELADHADLVICEATFLEEHSELAAGGGHMTATQAAELARDARAGLLVLSHFSARYPDSALFATEAREVFPDTIAAGDLQRIPVIRRDRR